MKGFLSSCNIFLSSPAFVIHGSDGGNQTKLHLAYHSMEHYSSVRSKDDPGDGPAHLFHRSKLLQKSSEKKTAADDNSTTEKKKTLQSVEKEIVKNNVGLQEPQEVHEKEDLEIVKTVEEKIAAIKLSTGYEVSFLILLRLHNFFS